ncbi:MAG: RNase H family protein [Pseudobdellovibrionaceae bacterium]
MSEALLDSSTIIFSDGACSGNPGPGGWGSVIVSPEGQVLELGGHEPETTNNQMELRAIFEALKRLKTRENPIHIFTDSVYVIKGIRFWIWGWMKNGWKNAQGEEVSNQELWKLLLREVKRHESSSSKKINWHYVRGHTGVPGNERVDEISVGFSKGPRPYLYKGSLLQYEVAIHDIPEDTELPEARPKEEKKVAFSYLSLINGKLEKHKTWKECEARVKGRPGAKFKKAISAADERKILDEWGIREE